MVLASRCPSGKKKKIPSVPDRKDLGMFREASLNCRKIEDLFHGSHVAMNVLSDIRMPDVSLSLTVEAYSCTASCSSTCHCCLALQSIIFPRLACDERILFDSGAGIHIQ